MRFFLLILAYLISAFGCEKPLAPQSPSDTTPLPEARQGFQTKILRRETSSEQPPVPPDGVLDFVRYPSPVGDLAAYLSPNPGDGQKHPAIIWIHGGESHSIDDLAWSPGSPENDQSAHQYSEGGVIIMYPSLRGGSGNPGVNESFFGEVDDVIAAADFLAKQSFVDPSRIYLGGHSTGGTLVLLVAECSDRFRAIFSFGPVAVIGQYGDDFVTCDPTDEKEMMLRSPTLWLPSIKSPTFIIEGSEGNIDALQFMRKNSTNPHIIFVEVPAANHFEILGPTNRLIAQKIIADKSASASIRLSPDEVVAHLRR